MPSSAGRWPRRSASAPSASAARARADLPEAGKTPLRLGGAAFFIGAHALREGYFPLDMAGMTQRSIDIEALCAEKGLRITEQRKVIAQVLGESEDHPDVEKLHARAAAIDPGISI